MKEFISKVRETMVSTGSMEKSKEVRKSFLLHLKNAWQEYEEDMGFEEDMGIKEILMLLYLRTLCVVIALPVLFAYVIQIAFSYLVFFFKLIWVICNIIFATPPLTLENENVCKEIIRIMYDTSVSASDILSEHIYTPNTVNDMYDGANILGKYNDAPLLKLRFYAKQNSTGYYNKRIRDVFQGKVNSRINDGHMTFSWAVQAATDIPLIKIATVEYSENYYHIGILLTNSAESVKAARLSDGSTPQATIFRGGSTPGE